MWLSCLQSALSYHSERYAYNGAKRRWLYPLHYVVVKYSNIKTNHQISEHWTAYTSCQIYCNLCCLRMLQVTVFNFSRSIYVYKLQMITKSSVVTVNILRKQRVQDGGPSKVSSQKVLRIAGSGIFLQAACLLASNRQLQSNERKWRAHVWTHTPPPQR